MKMNHKKKRRISRKALFIVSFLVALILFGAWLDVFWPGLIFSPLSSIKGYTVRCVGRLGRPALPFLIKALGDSDNYPSGADNSSSPSSEAYRALRKIGVPAVEPLISVLKNEPNGWARMNAAGLLGEIRDHRAVEPLIAALKDKYWLVRQIAASSLGRIGDPRAIEPLIAALKDESWNVRCTAAQSLLSYKNDSRIIEPLTILLSDDSEHVRSMATYVLKEAKQKKIK